MKIYYIKREECEHNFSLFLFVFMSGNRKKGRMMSVSVCSVASSKVRYCY